jgi:peptide/nickel transport system permease protein
VSASASGSRLPAGRIGPRRIALLRDHPLLAYVIRRILTGVGLALVVSFIVFGATQILPGNAAASILGDKATPEAVALVEEELGLDRPILVQYRDWITDFVRGDLGASFGAQVPVEDIIGKRAENTITLGLISLALIIPISILMGVLSGLRPGRAFDHTVSFYSLVNIALPEFVVGTFLIALLGVRLGWFPPVSLIPPEDSALSHPDLLVLPVLTLVIGAIAYNNRLVRAGVIDAMRSDYVRTGRLNGLSERRVVWRHALPNALAPGVQIFASTVQWLLGGAIAVEVVFGFPGLGQGLVDAVNVRDIPVVQAIAMYIALLYIGINIVADLITVLLIPKLRTMQ